MKISIDQVNPDVTKDGSLVRELIHPNDQGCRIMAEQFYEAMKPYL